MFDIPMGESEIANSFKGQTVLLTGVTGFVGKLMLEKLIRGCPDVRSILVLIRRKKGQSGRERLAELLELPCFEPLRRRRLLDWSRLRVVEGDCSAPDLGLAAEDRALIAAETTIIIHVAANVRFDLSLRSCFEDNVWPVWTLLEMAQGMPQLKAFIYVSTAYSHCDLSRINETFYDPPIAPEKLKMLLDNLDDETLQELTPKILGKLPNTYVFSKAIAEEVVRTRAGRVPFAVVRPGIVISSAEEPIVGWIDNFFGPVGLTVAASLGVVRAINACPAAPANLVPVDYVCNATLAAAWSAVTGGPNKVYNVCFAEKNILTWGEFSRVTVDECSWTYPSNQILWYYGHTMIESRFWYDIYVFFVQTIPAHLVDVIVGLMGKRKFAVKTWRKAQAMMRATSYFSVKRFHFGIDNLTELYAKMSDADKTNFNFDMETIDWPIYVKNCIVGGRVYLLKDPLDTVPQAQKKLRYLFVAHYTLMSFMVFLFYCFLKFVYDRVF